MEWKDWSNVLFSERYSLPECSGIYVIADANNYVWYVGKAANLKSRWVGKAHHRYPQLVRSNRKLCHRIYWKEFSVSSLDEQERYYIDLFEPGLNGCKVKKYLPKQPQTKREIKRLLKVLNKPTTLFPVIRSIVAGQYKYLSGIDCIVIFININDETIIRNSMSKRYAHQVKAAWSYCKTCCGKDEQQYSQVWIPTYKFDGYKFEFVITEWDFFKHLEENPEARESYLGAAKIFGVQVKALKSLNILDAIPMYDGKKSLTSAAYINYRKHVLKCLLELP